MGTNGKNKAYYGNQTIQSVTGSRPNLENFNTNTAQGNKFSNPNLRKVEEAQTVKRYESSGLLPPTQDNQLLNSGISNVSTNKVLFNS